MIVIYHASHITAPLTNLQNRNPNVPGQKLKVTIPKNADMEKRTFVVGVPMPKVKENPLDAKDNNLSREFKEVRPVVSSVFQRLQCSFSHFPSCDTASSRVLERVRRLVRRGR